MFDTETTVFDHVSTRLHLQDDQPPLETASSVAYSTRPKRRPLCHCESVSDQRSNAGPTRVVLIVCTSEVGYPNIG